MSTLLRLGLLLAALFSVVSSSPTYSLAGHGVYSNCSGSHPVPLPDDVDASASYRPQIHYDQKDTLKNGTGWEEWLFLAHNLLPDGSELIYSYKWGMGDPTSANVSHQTFVIWAYFANGTFLHEVVRDEFKYVEGQDGIFTISVADNHLTWDPTSASWNTSVNIAGWTVETATLE